MNEPAAVPATHAFVVPVFGRPQWLDRCLISLRSQTRPSPVIVTTSTPSEYIDSVAARYGVPVTVNRTSEGIAADWNFAFRQAPTEWVTLAHQDDRYSPTYTQACMAAAESARQPLMVFTAAHESLAPGGPLVTNARFKRAIAGSVFLGRRSITSRLSKRLLLSLGNPIPCPSVMLHKALLQDFVFPDGWASNLDWKAWLDLASKPGAFVYVHEALVQRTLHADAATTRHLHTRAAEDTRMFLELWPRPIARLISVLYAGSRKPYVAIRRNRPGRENGPRT
jgi:hypothetical protein